MPAGDSDRPNKLHGRRRGRPLSARRSEIVSRRYSDLILDLEADPPHDASRLFENPVTSMRLEIGSGGGEHLVHEAETFPDTGFIGVEPFQEGLAKTFAAIEERGLRNIRFYDNDAALLLDWLPAASLERVDILYPDPWPKRRHWKRRFVSRANLDRIARVLKTDGELRVASDIPDYIDWTLRAVLPRIDFEWTAEGPDDWRRPWQGWPGTRYEAKALREGRTPAYLSFRRIRDGS